MPQTKQPSGSMNPGSNLIEFAPEPDARPSLTEVFEAEESRLLHYAYGYVKRRAVAEELVQDAFLKLHKDWQTVEHPRAWLFRVIRNLALNHLRKGRRETLTDDTDTNSEGTDNDSTKNQPDLDLARREAVGQLREVLSELKPEDRELIRLKYQENHTYSQIGDALEIGPGNVGFRLHHLLKSLASRLREDGLSGSQG